MNEKFNKNAKVEQLTEMFLSRWEEKGLIVKDPLFWFRKAFFCKITKSNNPIRKIDVTLLFLITLLL